MGLAIALIVIGAILAFILHAYFWIGIILIAVGLILLATSRDRWYGSGPGPRRYWY